MMENPEYLDVRKLYKGVQTKENFNLDKKGKNCHCIMEFSAIRPRERPKKPIYGPVEGEKPKPRPIFL